MRALVMTEAGGAEHSHVREVEPPQPGPGQVAIRVAYAGLNFVDVMARRGDGGYTAAWPHHPGKEVAGTVLALGPGVTHLAIGTPVVAATHAGGLAEVALADADLTVPVPDGVPLEAAAAAPLGLATALLLLTDAGRFTPGDTVLVHSASGGIGGAVARLLPLLGGGRLLGTVGRPAKAAAAERTGYDAVFARDADLADRLREASGGRIDLVLDPLGTDSLELDLDLLAPGGRIVLFGNAAGERPADLPPFGRLLGANATLTGFSHSALLAGAPGKVADAIRRTLDLLATGALDAPVTVLPDLTAVPAAHDLLATGHAEGKYVVALQG
ncbi:zinc-binding dehydrogenase [Streptomyces sp. TLI_171]|uniref:quinone oxidoreductase family protein n=1 Tax=Streptomyces sp. TLI_171 TaxID=1938859 RepID=UPI000C1A4765|nr:zinc-binding dehydrogenase [Streptomyces sp. TLI_171]RKE19405.1 NADPH:quinone reductase-like Zn-dependent oxidoreductase [Streptomyces sp. TLI_171]